MSDRAALASLDQAARLVFEWRKGADVQDLILDMERIRQDIALRAAPAPLDGLTIGPITHSNSMCQKDGCTCWCQACERHNWRVEAAPASLDKEIRRDLPASKSRATDGL